jgi:hypothetical protein
MKTPMRKLLVLVGLLSGLQLHASMSNANATEPSVTQPNATAPNGDVLMYIEPVEYSNPIRVSSRYRDYWYHQGPVVETMALERISQAYGKTSLCDAAQSGKMLLWVKPKMFYNPKMQNFYGNATIKVYTGLGKHVGTYEGASTVRGFIDIKPQRWIKQSYELAIDDAIAKMQADVELQRVVAHVAAPNAETTPCSMVSLIPTSKIRAMSF